MQYTCLQSLEITSKRMHSTAQASLPCIQANHTVKLESQMWHHSTLGTTVAMHACHWIHKRRQLSVRRFDRASTPRCFPARDSVANNLRDHAPYGDVMSTIRVDHRKDLAHVHPDSHLITSLRSSPAPPRALACPLFRTLDCRHGNSFPYFSPPRSPQYHRQSSTDNSPSAHTRKTSSCASVQPDHERLHATPAGRSKTPCPRSTRQGRLHAAGTFACVLPRLDSGTDKSTAGTLTTSQPYDRADAEGVRGRRKALS